MDKMAVVRILVFAFAWLNQYLVSKGHQPLPVLGEEEVAAIVTFGASIWALAKDNKVKKSPEQPAE